MKVIGGLFRRFVLLVVLAAAFALPVRADDYYYFDLDVSNSNNQESAVLTATDTSGNVKWRYQSASYPITQLSHFALVMNDHGCIYLVEDGAIKAFDFYTGNVKWTNRDFQGHPANGCYAFSSSDKLYISGYFGPDLFVVDKNGQTVCRVKELDPGSCWIDRMYFSGGDNMTVHFGNPDKNFTFNVLDYFNRRDGLSSSGSSGGSSAPSAQSYTPEQLCSMAQSYYQRHFGYYPPAADYENNGDGTYTIHLYENVNDGEFSHTATSAWYRVNSQGIGNDVIMGDSVDLSN